MVIVNDFRRSQLREVKGFSYLLDITDRYDVMVETKGGVVLGLWDEIIITCPNDPITEFTYHGDDGDRVDENLGQLIRRLSYVIELRILDGKVEEFDRAPELKRQYGIGQFECLQQSRILNVVLG